MFIKKIIITDFRIYYAENVLEFEKQDDKNVFIISGNNGYGKTTLLTSLLWNLYGKLMIDVDDKYRAEIYESGGYRKFAISNLNRFAKSENKKYYSVQIYLSDVFIPSIPCEEVSIKRVFNIDYKDDKLEILIDGKPNELTNEVGPEIFINDFILPKEIAKFFFFDAEKIVSLAEIKTAEDKLQLSRAYSEVLGIKKYEDLKANLEGLRIRLRKETLSEGERKKANELQLECEKILKSISTIDSQLTELNDERAFKKSMSEEVQEKLIREGHSLSIEELHFLKSRKKELEEESESLKQNIKELLDFAPFVIASKSTIEVFQQLKVEAQYKISKNNPDYLQKKIRSFEKSLIQNLKKKKIKSAVIKEVISLVKSQSLKILFNQNKLNVQNNVILHDYDDKEYNDFNAIFNNLKHSFSVQFKEIFRSHRDNRIAQLKITKKISDAETKEKDLFIQKIRQEKLLIESQISEIENNIISLNQMKGSLHNEYSNKQKILSELTKLVSVQEKDIKKDEVAKRTIENLTKYLYELKLEKKNSLEDRILNELHLLMHKKNFISRVEVEILGDFIEINLYDIRNERIQKELLSKGEQQLYATALLKALVDESDFKFPVFVDSPLQKFDKDHSKNIISEFYPKISKQVTIFPLLNKELTKEEFALLEPKLNACYIIKNLSQDKSIFLKVKTSELFKFNYSMDKNVYQY